MESVWRIRCNSKCLPSSFKNIKFHVEVLILCLRKRFLKNTIEMRKILGGKVARITVCIKLISQTQILYKQLLLIIQIV